MLRYSIIVPVRNDRSHMGQCLERLVRLNYPKSAFEVIMVDNGSDDGTPVWVREHFPTVTVCCENRVPSSYSARNRGVQEAKAEWILFIDSDCVASPEILNAYDRYLAEHQREAVAGGIRFTFKNPDNPFEIYDSKRWLQQEKFASESNFGCTANLLVRRDLFFRIGGFPEGLRSGGDRIFGTRLAQIGIKIGYAGEAFVSHPTRRSLHELMAKARRIGAGNREAYERFRDDQFKQNQIQLLWPRFGRVALMLNGVSPVRALYRTLLSIDWKVNCAMWWGYLNVRNRNGGFHATASTGSRMQGVAVVMPAFQEGGHIGPLVCSVKRLGFVKACVVVSDGSTDSTAKEAESAGAQVIRLPYNLGYGAALQTGIRYAYEEGHEYAITMDADGQHAVDSAPELVAEICKNQHDLVIGSRFLSPGNFRLTVAKRIAIGSFRIVLRALGGVKISDPTSGFLAMNRDAMRFCLTEWYPTDYPDANALLMMTRAGLRITEIPVRMKLREYGTSMHSGWKPVSYLYKVCFSMGVTLFRRIPKSWREDEHVAS